MNGKLITGTGSLHEERLDRSATRALVCEILEREAGRPGALIEILSQVQDAVGFLPLSVQVQVAKGLDIPVSEVYGVVTFYSLFSLVPRGRYRISVCKGTACYVREAGGVIDSLERELDIKVGETTADGMFSLDVVRCLGACGLGPVMMVNNDVHASLKAEHVPGILVSYRHKDQENLVATASGSMGGEGD